jgi:RNA polymerase sigma factor (sigma-70 family)
LAALFIPAAEKNMPPARVTDQSAQLFSLRGNKRGAAPVYLGAGNCITRPGVPCLSNSCASIRRKPSLPTGKNNVDSNAILAELPRLRRYARALVGDKAAADDLVQDTLERAWARFAQSKIGNNFRGWLFSIMHNLRMDQFRRAELPTDSFEDEDFEMPTRATQADQLEVRDLDAALGQLPDEQRAVLLLIALEEMSYDDVARTLNIPPGTVMSRLARGRERLRILLDRQKPATTLRVVR